MTTRRPCASATKSSCSFKKGHGGDSKSRASKEGSIVSHFCATLRPENEHHHLGTYVRDSGTILPLNQTQPSVLTVEPICPTDFSRLQVGFPKVTHPGYSCSDNT